MTKPFSWLAFQWSQPLDGSNPVFTQGSPGIRVHHIEGHMNTNLDSICDIGMTLKRASDGMLLHWFRNDNYSRPVGLNATVSTVYFDPPFDLPVGDSLIVELLNVGNPAFTSGYALLLYGEKLP